MPLQDRSSARRRVAGVHARLAAFAGAIVLGLAAIGFAWLGDWAQGVFARVVARHAWLPLIVTPLAFAAIAHVTRLWFADARGSGIPKVMAVSHVPERYEQGQLISLRTAAAKLVGTLAMLLVGVSAGR